MLYQYHGNDMEALRDAACTLLGAAPAPPLVAERLIVPNVGMAKWLRQANERRQLSQLDSRELSDLGISPGERMAELSKPFWRD